MSFSSNAKQEILNLRNMHKNCDKAEIFGMVDSFSNIYFEDEQVLIKIDNENIAKKFFTICSELYKMDLETEDGYLKLKKNDYNKLLLESESFYQNSNNNCCKRAYLKGCFLICGSITQPEKSYHLELHIKQEYIKDFVINLLTSFELQPKSILYHDSYVIYIKESEQISEFLKLIGASVSMFEFENARIIKEMRNNVNRIVNCETANLTKTVLAAQKQIADIKYIEETEGLSFLSAHLQEISKLRLTFPDDSLQEIGQKLSTPLGKSGVNHRLRKISKIASKLRDTKGVHIMTETHITIGKDVDANFLANFVQLANNFTSKITVVNQEKKANAKSIMGVISLQIIKGSELLIIADGADDAAALKDLCAFLE